ncbi:hypothetical protein C7B64_05260 [Merismopedia glauca CCAP 1448/3]|uniref:Uncharacterized protein n=1 Tax=Merismopedia glauca CCAP 1448/3 TaxID=1296344 RepID=A0A2T1C7A8_9CYAN|nr:hypothetical protein C7B64_05260 [Merismopedia glauca CCAP 1448/3]
MSRERRSRGAEEQRSRGAEERRSGGAEEQRSRGAEGIQSDRSYLFSPSPQPLSPQSSHNRSL